MTTFPSALVVAVLLVGLVTPLQSHAEDEVQDARVQMGKVAYDRYCASCHGAGGAPGSAVSAATKKPIDLRTYVQRHGGKFPREKWFDAVFVPEPGAVHTPVWETIRSAQTDSEDRDILARGVVQKIADYLVSIQNK